MAGPLSGVPNWAKDHFKRSIMARSLFKLTLVNLSLVYGWKKSTEL